MSSNTNNPGSLFGNTSSTSPFRSCPPGNTATSGNLFGSSQTAVKSNSCFGSTTATGGPFGTSQAEQQHQFGFGSSNSGFGNPKKTHSGGLFAQSNGNNAGGVPFGTNANTASSGGLFGQNRPMSTAANLFGNRPTSTSCGDLFGQLRPATTSGNLFGSFQPTNTTSSGPNLFSQQTQNNNATQTCNPWRPTQENNEPPKPSVFGPSSWSSNTQTLHGLPGQPASQSLFGSQAASNSTHISLLGNSIPNTHGANTVFGGVTTDNTITANAAPGASQPQPAQFFCASAHPKKVEATSCQPENTATPTQWCQPGPARTADGVCSGCKERESSTIKQNANEKYDSNPAVSVSNRYDTQPFRPLLVSEPYGLAPKLAAFHSVSARHPDISHEELRMHQTYPSLNYPRAPHVEIFGSGSALTQVHEIRQDETRNYEKSLAAKDKEIDALKTQIALLKLSAAEKEKPTKSSGAGTGTRLCLISEIENENDRNDKVVEAIAKPSSAGAALISQPALFEAKRLTKAETSLIKDEVSAIMKGYAEQQEDMNRKLNVLLETVDSNAKSLDRSPPTKTGEQSAKPTPPPVLATSPTKDRQVYFIRPNPTPHAAAEVAPIESGMSTPVEVLTPGSSVDSSPSTTAAALVEDDGEDEFWVCGPTDLEKAAAVTATASKESGKQTGLCSIEPNAHYNIPLEVIERLVGPVRSPPLADGVAVSDLATRIHKWLDRVDVARAGFHVTAYARALGVDPLPAWCASMELVEHGLARATDDADGTGYKFVVLIPVEDNVRVVADQV